MTLRRQTHKLSHGTYDLIIIGGGAFGCCAAWEAASRGLRVALIEREDFCGATSANHLKIVHGGIRYLQHLDLRRVRKSMKERSALLRIAPHLVTPLPIVMPTYGSGLEGRFVLGAGFLLYDIITADRNRGIVDGDRRIPRSRLLSREESLNLYPWLASDTLTGAGLFYDAQFVNPQRLSWAFLRSAIQAGARVANYVEATDLLVQAGRLTGIAARDRLRDVPLEIRGAVVLNAAGPWAARLVRETLDLDVREPTFSRDAGFVVRGRRTGDHGLACRLRTRDPDAVLSRHGRHVFLVPWRDYTLIGVWHRVHRSGLEDVQVEEAELRRWVGELNAVYPVLGITRDDISMVYSGLTLFADDNDPDAEDLRFGKRSRLIDHEREHGLPGLLTLIGIRATMARGVAETAVDRVAEKLERPVTSSRTAFTPVWGGRIASFEKLVQDLVERHGTVHDAMTLREIAHCYGTRSGTILGLAREEPHLGGTIGASRTLRAQVVHAVRHELARKLGDVVFRRTALGTGADPGREALRECAELMADELGWDGGRVEQELQEVESEFPRSVTAA